MKYSTPTFLALSMLASSAQADPAIVVDMQPHAAPDNIMKPGQSFEKHIIGGSDADENSFPYFVSFGDCGGTLIAPDVVLFAAHCENAENKQVLINSSRFAREDEKTEMRYCDIWVEHDDYSGDPLYRNDFALCKLDNPVYIDSNIELEWNKDPDFDVGGELTVMGYGATGKAWKPALQHTTVKAYSDEFCNSAYASLFVGSSMICAGDDNGGRDTCQGDSGGPMVKRKKIASKTIDTIVGITSFGSNCGSKSQPGIYAKVSSAKDWIGWNVCDEFESVADWCVCDDEDWCNDEQQQTPDDNGCDPDTEVAFEFEVNTDDHAMETSWTLKERKHGTEDVSAAKYLTILNKNVHTICLKKRMCYKFKIMDSHGDGLCEALGEPRMNNCRPFSLGLPGRDRYFEYTDNFKFKMIKKFCIDDVGEPTKRWPPKNPNKAARKQNRKNKNKNNNLRH